MKVYEALAQGFVAEGTSAVFGMMGDANMFWMNALSKLGVKTYDVRHEGSGLAMADGWARATGEVGVCTTTSGPGCAQLATTMIVASRARTPLVAFCGEVALGDDEAPQRLDQERFAAAIEAGFVRVLRPDHAFREVQKAFYLARSESRPIMLSAPMDVQQEPFDDEEYVPSTTLLPTSPVRPDPELIDTVADALSRSRRPVIIAGRGALRSGAGPAIRSLAERTGAIIATTLMAKNWLADDDFHVGIAGLYATRNAIELFQEADCVIGVGASLNKHTTEHGYLFPDAAYVQIDVKPHALMGGQRAADHYLRADARLAVQALNNGLERRQVRSAGYRTAIVKQKIDVAWHDPQTYDVEPGLIDPRDACRVLDEVIPEDIGLILDAGQQVCFGMVLFRRPRRYVMSNQQFGCIGQGVTTGIGAVLATGNRPAFLMEGDAGLMMHLGEFETAVRYGVPLLVVVLNDESLGAEYHKSIAKGLNDDLTRISTPNLGVLGQALGGRGELIKSLDELRAAAEKFVADPVPTILDVRISREVLSIPFRRLLYGQDA